MSGQVMTVGTLSAGRGERKFGVNEFKIQTGTYTLPMWIINGAAPGPTLAITGGVHAAEYASIAAALEIGRGLRAADLHGRVIVIPVLNVPGFSARSIYTFPLDGKNLNRVFPGNTDGSASEQVADWVFRNVMKQSDYYADLHGGDLIEALVPFTIFFRSGDQKIDETSMEMAKVFGIHYLVRGETPGSAYSSAATAGIPSILAEAGGQGIWPPEEVARLTGGINRLMRHLKMLDGPKPDPLPYTLLDQFLWLRSAHDGFWYPTVAVGDAVKKGANLGSVQNYQGEVLQNAICPADGRVLFIVSSLAINNNDPLLAVGA